MNRKKTKICLVCGKDFSGNEAAFTCSPACRTYMSRNLKKGKKPEFWLLAKSKGQKVPLFFAPPVPKKDKKEDVREKVDYKEPDQNSYDGKSISMAEMDEVGKNAPVKPLSPEQRYEIEKTIRTINLEKCPSNVHPKTFILNQQMRVSELEDKLKQA